MNSTNMLFDVTMIAALWFAIGLTRGICFDARGGFVSWWLRPVMMVLTAVITVSCSAICMASSYAISHVGTMTMSYGLLLGTFSLVVMIVCGSILVGSAIMFALLPFINDCEI